jgi:hypothetical protein
MKSLNSVGKARRTLLATGIGMFFAFLFLAPLAVFAAGSVTITLDKTTYVNGNTIHVSGTITPAPTTAGTSVAVTITGPNNGLVDASQFVVSTATGNYNGTFVAGGPQYTVNGTYTITASYNGATASQIFQFGNNTGGGGSSGTTTTLIVTSITTIVQAGGATTTTVISPGATTTVVQAGATVVTTIVSQQQTTVTLSPQADSTALALGAVALIVGIIAAVIAVLTMRKK